MQARGSKWLWAMLLLGEDNKVWQRGSSRSLTEPGQGGPDGLIGQWKCGTAGERLLADIGGQMQMGSNG
jgi:hypothetical protein